MPVSCCCRRMTWITDGSLIGGTGPLLEHFLSGQSAAGMRRLGPLCSTRERQEPIKEKEPCAGQAAATNLEDDRR